VTAEFAVLLPGFVLLVAFLIAAASAGAAQLRCVDAARSAARLAARHESASVVVASARAAGPSGVVLQVDSASGLVRVRASAKVSLPLPGRPELPIAATALAYLEPANDMGPG
jgi:hypothetical protein